VIFDYNKVMYVYKKYKKILALFINFATIDSQYAYRIKIISRARW